MNREEEAEAVYRVLSLVMIDAKIEESKQEAFSRGDSFSVLALSICGDSKMPRVNKESFINRLIEMEIEMYLIAGKPIDPISYKERTTKHYNKVLDVIQKVIDIIETGQANLPNGDDDDGWLDEI